VELLGEVGDNLCSAIKVLDAPTDNYKVNANINASGVAVFNSINNELVELATNNGISSYSLDIVVPDAIKDNVILTSLSEGFESVATGELPADWLAFADSVTAGNPVPAWRVTDYVAHTGAKSVYMPNYNTKSNCWLVTPAMSLNTDSKYLTLYAKDDWNTASNDFESALSVYISTKSQNNPADFQWVATWNESEFYDKWGYKSIDISGIEGEYVYVGFMVHNFGDPNNADAGGDNWCIDDVMLSDTLTAITGTDNGLPKEYALSQNYPNPFNPTTSFNVALPKSGNVSIVIYNMLGQEVMKVFDGNLNAGIHKFEFNASRFASGMYFYRVQADKFTAVKKMVLMK